jgi:transposase-like protein
MKAKIEYPKTLLEAVRLFADQKVAHDFMVRMRWPDGVKCPHCGSEHVNYISTRRIWKCNKCPGRRQFSVKVGTIFEDSPLGFDKWLPAFWMAVNCKNGISSYELARALGVTQKSAWFMLGRIRLALANGNVEKLSGQVEADETFIGGLAKNMHERRRKHLGTGGAGKAIVMGLVQRNGPAVAKVIPNVQRRTLHGEIRRHVKPGSAVFTDAYTSYEGLGPQFAHASVDHAKEYVRGDVHTNTVDNFWSLLKRSIKGTYVHVDPSHLHRYVDEQAYRYNERTVKDSDRFVKAARSVTGKRLTYRQLTGKDRLGGNAAN